MRFVVCVYLAVVLSVSLATPLIWDRTYAFGTADEISFYCVQQTDSGDYVACGRAHYQPGPYSTTHPLVARFSDTGDVLWCKQVSTQGGSANWVVESPDGDLVAVGAITSYLTPYIFLWKLTADGETEWFRTFAHQEERFAQGYGVACMPGGGYVATGYCEQSSREEGALDRIWVMRSDEQGDTLWTRTFKGSCEYAIGRSILADQDGSIVVSGRGVIAKSGDSCDPRGHYRPLLARLSPDGVVESFVLYSAWPDEAGALELARTIDAGYCFITDAQLPAIPGDRRVCRVDEEGTIWWLEQMDYSELEERLLGLDGTVDGGWVVVGYCGYSAGVRQPDAWILKLEPDGDLEWQDVYGGEELWEYFESVCETSDGGYICCGRVGDEGLLVRFGPEEGVESGEPAGGLVLSPPCPNPVHSSATLCFSLNGVSQVSLCAFDVSGHLLEEIASGTYSAGAHEVEWTPSGVEPGCFLIRLATPEAHLAQRCIYLP